MHVSACLFVLMASVEQDYEVSWMADYYPSTDFYQYVTSLYFIVTTTATVGYGDISPKNTYERIFCVVLMIVGVTSFSFVTGSLSSIMANYDQNQAVLQEKLLHLNKLKKINNIPDDLYDEIRSAVLFDSKRSTLDHDNFL